MMAETSYPSVFSLQDRLREVESDQRELREEVRKMRDTDQQAVLAVKVDNLRDEVKWLRYTLIGFIPVMSGVVAAILKAVGS